MISDQMTMFRSSLEKQLKSVQRERDAALEAKLGWITRQCIIYTAQEAEVAVHKETTKHAKRTKVRNAPFLHPVKPNLCI